MCKIEATPYQQQQDLYIGGVGITTHQLRYIYLSVIVYITFFPLIEMALLYKLKTNVVAHFVTRLEMDSCTYRAPLINIYFTPPPHKMHSSCKSKVIVKCRIDWCFAGV